MSFEGNAPGCVRTVYSGMKLKPAANSSVVADKASSFEKHGKGSDDPIKMANKFDGLEDGMDFS